jgi:hypothetical protein
VGFSLVNPARNTSKVTPVAHPRVDPYDLHHPTGHKRRTRELTGPRHLPRNAGSRMPSRSEQHTCMLSDVAGL